MVDELYPPQGPQSQQAHSTPHRKPPPPPSVTDVAARLKVLEQRYANLTRREQLAEQNLLSFEKDLRADLKAVQQRILETKRHISELRERLDTLTGGVANAVQRHELKELDSYLEIWKPTEFLTREEAKRLIEAIAIDIRDKTKRNK